MSPLVRVRDLVVAFGGRPAVRGVSFDVERGQVVALVGESGSGKSVTARSLLGLCGRGAVVEADELAFDGLDLRSLGERQWRGLRGRRVGLVAQDALGSLDPLRRVGAEVAEPLREHRIVDRVRPEVLRLLADAGVPEPEVRERQWSHQLSGGLRQRALIATALAARPELLIADEPTTALDATVQKQVLGLLRAKAAAGTALLLISHDLAVVADLADYVHVMKDGAVVEHGVPADVLTNPRHPYTRALLNAVPTAERRGRGLSGTIPALDQPDRRVPGRELITVTDVVKRYRVRGRPPITAAAGVSFTVRAGETLGIVGESGSGKSTVGRMLLGLVAPDSGAVEFDGVPWSARAGAERRAARRRIQMIYQDPLASFDPRYTGRQIVTEANPDPERVAELLRLVGLAESQVDRPARELSGGQRQRLAIARALAADPAVIVCDEPVSALDVSIQAQVLDVLVDAQRRLGVAYVFISHDLGVVHHIADRVLVMRDGAVVESGSATAVLAEPRHQYTKDLVAAVPGTVLRQAQSVLKPG
ncbi:ABC transporter ATP-binding protein [Actinokineospora auranticolor]|uniref:Peptide/nickel transport system ATP-binding protein n=1 Tax=Actinokineospora auranticolor TaxID=155976 RepID=A0A2S6H1P6_9PSEU|nr:ABC transporter ATP-binding protein [Actinokineospora auranticolor]PPK71418.1 peptide/nickel transport system ATP-binding protein [Actinokineospora auranticolor]